MNVREGAIKRTGDCPLLGCRWGAGAPEKERARGRESVCVGEIESVWGRDTDMEKKRLPTAGAPLGSWCVPRERASVRERGCVSERERVCVRESAIKRKRGCPLLGRRWGAGACRNPTPAFRTPDCETRHPTPATRHSIPDRHLIPDTRNLKPDTRNLGALYAMWSMERSAPSRC